MTGKLDGRIALVSGSGRGIGREIARKLASDGARVVVNDLDSDMAHETAATIRGAGGEALVCAGSVTEDGFAETFVGAAVNEFGGVDIIVNNAGYTWDSVVQKMTDEQWRAIIDVHLTAPFRILRAAQPVIAAVDGICAGAGAIIAMASDLRYGTPTAKTAFLFTRVGLAGCDMGACAMLPRIIGQGRASELLYTGRSMSADEGFSWGWFNSVVPAEQLSDAVRQLARTLASGPAFAHSMTKRCMHLEWNQTIEQALETEALAQSVCMQTEDFRRAYEAFVAKKTPQFQGN